MYKKIISMRSVAAIAALTLCGAASAAVQQGQVAFKDPKTGKVRNANAAEAKQLNDLRAAHRERQVAERKAAGAPVTGVVQLQSNGVEQMYVDDESVSYSVMKRDANGNMVQECVTGATALKQTMSTPATLPSKEHSHEVE